MGTAALEDPGLVATISERQPVALGLDVRGREVAVRGWAEGSGVDWSEALRRRADAGAEAVVVTHIDGEGLMGGAEDRKRACRERVGQYGMSVVGAGVAKKQTHAYQPRQTQ